LFKYDDTLGIKGLPKNKLTAKQVKETLMATF